MFVYIATMQRWKGVEWNAWIDTSRLAEFRTVTTDNDGMTVGNAVTLEELISALKNASGSKRNFFVLTLYLVLFYN